MIIHHIGRKSIPKLKKNVFFLRLLAIGGLREYIIRLFGRRPGEPCAIRGLSSNCEPETA